ncbi:MAG TPA: hypothetical protein VHC47_03565, partial [Mucilaginibacter sp.]|nr:hypothetical protein [Mucilaginibacter sp.]
LTFVFTLPEFYALYVQFDLHPEKVVFNKTNVSGIRWFLWDSQFGRFASSGPITRSSSDVLFYLHTLLWAFAPWCLLFYYSVYENVKAIIIRKKQREYYSFSGGIVLLLLFSVSRFQLPFYTNAIFPLFAIITAPVCVDRLSHFAVKFRQVGLWPYIILLPVAVLCIQYFSHSGHIAFLIADIIIFGAATGLLLVKNDSMVIKTFSLACIASLFANFYLNTVFYQELSDYKGEIKAADYTNQKMFDPYQNYVLSPENNIFQFYSKKQVSIMSPDSFKHFKPQYPSLFYVNHKMMGILRSMHVDFKVVKAFVDYPQENIQPVFINRNTRKQVLDSVYLVTK